MDSFLVQSDEKFSRFDHRQPRRVVSGVHLKIEKGENICNSTK